MNIVVSPCPSALKRINQKNKIVVIIDVLRACTTIVQAFSQGCRAFYPVPSVKKAMELKAVIGRQRTLCSLIQRGKISLSTTTTQSAIGAEETLLGGERKGLKIKGFDLGNSPSEYTADAVRNKNIIFTTSNCTKNLNALSTTGGQPKETLICSFLNIHFMVNYLTALNDDLIIALSGREGDFSLEDAVCAGMLIDGLLALNPPIPPFIKGGNGGISDLSLVCRITYLHYKNNIIDALANSTHGRILKNIGFEDDIKFCAQIGKYEILPKYMDGKILCIH